MGRDSLEFRITDIQFNVRQMKKIKHAANKQWAPLSYTEACWL